MRENVAISVSIAFVLIAPLTLSVAADIQITLLVAVETTVEPIVFTNTTWHEAPADICASDDGTVFTVNIAPLWQLQRGAAPASFIAWRSEGGILWSKNFTTWDMMLFGVATNGSHVYVTGEKSSSLYIGKYDLLGNEVWNVTHELGMADCGRRISISNGGDIIVSGSTPMFSDIVSDDTFLIGLDPNGNIKWQRTFPKPVSVACDLGFAYVLSNSSLQKYDSSGTLIWSTGYDENSTLFARNGTLYSITRGEPTYLASLSVNLWNAGDGTREWNSRITVTDKDSQLIHAYWSSSCLNLNKSLLTLFDAHENDKYLLVACNVEGNLLWDHTPLDSTWWLIESTMTGSGAFVVVGHINGGFLAMAVFDLDAENSAQLDIGLIGITSIGVIAFDAISIVFLKKRYAK